MNSCPRADIASTVHLTVFLLALQFAAMPALAAEAPTPSVVRGFGNSRDPIQIEADTVSVSTPDQIVIFTGNVVVKQKEATLATHELKVFYDNTPPVPGATPPPASDNGAPNAQLKRFEAAGGLKITEPNQTVTGESGWFDMASQKAEIDGNVLLTNAEGIASADKLLIDLPSGKYNLVGGGQKGPRVHVTVSPGKGPTATSKSR